MDALLDLADINFGNPAPPQRTQASLGAADPWGASAQPQADPWGGASASLPTSNMGALAALAAPPTSSSGNEILILSQSEVFSGYVIREPKGYDNGRLIDIFSQC